MAPISFPPPRASSPPRRGRAPRSAAPRRSAGRRRRSRRRDARRPAERRRAGSVRRPAARRGGTTWRARGPRPRSIRSCRSTRAGRSCRRRAGGRRRNRAGSSTGSTCFLPRFFHAALPRVRNGRIPNRVRARGGRTAPAAGRARRFAGPGSPCRSCRRRKSRPPRRNRKSASVASRASLPSARSSCSTRWRVTPLRNVPLAIGVITIPSFAMNTLAVASSATLPSMSQSRQLSKPRERASSSARRVVRIEAARLGLDRHGDRRAAWRKGERVIAMPVGCGSGAS